MRVVISVLLLTIVLMIIDSFIINTYLQDFDAIYLWIQIFLVIVVSALISFWISILQKKNKELEVLLDSSISGMAIFDNGKCVDVNKIAFLQSGYSSKEELIGKTFFDFVAEEEHPKLAEKLKSSQNYYFLTLKRKDGSTFPGLMKGTNINKKRRISSFIDISRLKKVQNDLEELTKNLEKRVEEEIAKNREQEMMMLQQSRFAQMGQTISMIAHQWKQPLNNLSLINQALSIQYRMGIVDEDIMNKFQKDSEKQILEMSDIIGDFSNFFKPNKGKELFDIEELIKDTIRLIKPTLEYEDIEVDSSFENSIRLKGYKKELAQAIINIINNAKDALVENKSNSLKKISIFLERKEDKIILSIADNAGGIPADIIDNIFDPYFSKKEKKSGTGLGLYISKVIIEKYSGGQLLVYNSDQGAVFVIKIPIDQNRHSSHL
jgi:PAS domain S-box-containing protein